MEHFYFAILIILVSHHIQWNLNITKCQGAGKIFSKYVNEVNEFSL